MKITHITLAAILLTLYLSPAYSFTAEEEKWLNSEDDIDTSHINEGKLEFLKASENQNVLHSINNLTIKKSSIDDGWVNLQQCYQHLDAIKSTAISYKYRFMKNLKLISYRNIDNVTIHDQSIELTNIKNNSEICIEAEVRIFYQNPDLSFSLINGPFHRRFLDGFYPYHVTLDITYPDDSLSFTKSTPKQSSLFSIERKKGKLLINTYFEGMLNTEIRFLIKE